MADYPSPGQHEFSADDEKRMRQQAATDAALKAMQNSADRMRQKMSVPVRRPE